MAELSQRQDRVANNLANANTVGYRRDRAFAEALEERIDAEGAPQSTRVAGQYADVQSGSFVETTNPMDLALEGDGFFAVQDDAGRVRYTRAGEFVLDAEGTVRSPQGHVLLRDDGTPFTIPPTAGDITVTTGGEIRVGASSLGTIQTVAVEDPLQLVRLDGATFASDGLAVRPSEARVRQGLLETSNVDAVGEMVDLMEHVRLFESQQKALKTTDEILGSVTRDLGSFEEWRDRG